MNLREISLRYGEEVGVAGVLKRENSVDLLTVWMRRKNKSLSHLSDV